MPIEPVLFDAMVQVEYTIDDPPEQNVAALFSENQRIIALLMAEKEEPEEDDRPVIFDIERDRNGFMTTVTARPQ